MDMDKVEGTLKEGQGKVKEEWGDATDDRSTEMEGHGDQLGGKAEQGWGDAKDKIGECTDRKDGDENR